MRNMTKGNSGGVSGMDVDFRKPWVLIAGLILIALVLAAVYYMLG